MIQKISYKIIHNKNRRTKQDGTALINIEMRQEGRRIWLSTRMYVRPDQWQGGYVVNHPLADDYNSTLMTMLLDVERVELDFIKRGVYPTLAMMRNAVREHCSPSAGFCNFGREFINKSNRKLQTKDSYNTTFRSIEKFRKNLTLADVDYPFITSYEHYLRQQGNAHNTVVGRLRNIRAVLNEAVKRDMLQSSPFDKYSIPGMISKEETLSLHEISKLARLCLKGHEKVIRDAFLFACYTGLRYSDIRTLTSDDIKIKRGKRWLVKKTKKTGEMTQVPVEQLWGGKAMTIIDEYQDISVLSHIGHNASSNRTLQELGTRAGIRTHLHWHLARHTCISNLITEGLPITTTQIIIGHKKLDTTRRYAQLGEEAIRNDLKKIVKRRKA